MIDQWGVGHEPSPNSMHMTYMRHPLENAETLEELEAYARFGNAVASLCVEKRGAIPAMPDLRRAEERMEEIR